MTHDLVIIGGGIVGAAAAHRATAVGASVLLFDRGDVGRATDAGAGIVGPGLNKRDTGPLLNLALAAARAYPDLVADLGSASDATATAVDAAYERVGLLAVAVDDDELEGFAAFEKVVMERQERFGHPTGHQITAITPEEARRLYPVLGEVKAAVLDSGAARVDGRGLTAALLSAAMASGAEVRSESVESIAAVAADAGSVIIAGGAWSTQFEQELGVTIPVQPQRGQIIHLAPSSALGPTARWPMLSLLTDQYQVSWPDGRVAVGATREHGSGFALTSTVAGVQAVLNEAVRAAPGLSDAELLEVRVGLRPVTPDLRPVIGRIPGHHHDVVVATGHGPTGLTSGPYSGRLAADLALGRTVEHDLAPFAVDRDFTLA